MPIWRMLRVQSQIEFRVALMNKRAPSICAAAGRRVLKKKTRGGEAAAWLVAQGSKSSLTCHTWSVKMSMAMPLSICVLCRASGTKTEMHLLFFCATHRNQTYIKTWTNNQTPDADLQKPKIHRLPPETAMTYTWLFLSASQKHFLNFVGVVQVAPLQGHPAWLLLSS